MAQTKKTGQAFRLKGTMPAVTMLALETTDVAAIEAQLIDHISQMPAFFLHAPVMLDLDLLEGASVDLAALASVLRQHHLVPVAVRNPSDAVKAEAVRSGWGVLQSSLVRPPPRPPQAPVDETGQGQGPRGRVEAPPSQAIPPADLPLAGLTVRQTVRSGNVVYAAGGDLVVLASVSSGAEVIADGNVHVYGALRGRALAGAHDNPDASIFCTSLEAELLSIAGRHLLAEEIPAPFRGKPARVHLQDDKMTVSKLASA